MNLNYHRTVIGYHGCSASVARDVLNGTRKLRPSSNEEDWLGKGIYFWEHGPERALRWARNDKGIKKPQVLGALIHLGDCLDLLDCKYTEMLSETLSIFEPLVKNAPQNKGKARRLDCWIINVTLPVIEKFNGAQFHTVRCAFIEGKPICEGSGIMTETHIQIAVRNPACILGFFKPS